MSKLAALIWVVMIIGTAFLLYSLKYEVQALHAQMAQTEHELENEREALNVVAAEWEYLNRPERLQALAGKYLGTSSTTVNQVAVVQAIPFPARMQASNDTQARDARDSRLQPQPVRFRAETGGGQ